MPPSTLGPYRIVAELARGGMGVVYRALDPRLEREVALKVILPEAVDPDGLLRFRAEAQAAARLRHPHIVGLLDVGQDHGHPYLVMDLIEGESLQARLEREGPLPHDEVVRIAGALAGALTYAHLEGVLHRDLKPQNVLLDRRGQPLLTDFGLARMLDRESRLTQTGEVLGTPVYMAPEQATGGEVDLTTDVYGLGGLLYAMLTARPPFAAGQGVLATLAAITTERPSPPRSIVPGVDPALEALCLACLAREPAQRPADAAAVGRRLKGLQERTGRRAGLLPVLTVGLLAAGLGGWAWTLRDRAARAEQALALAERSASEADAKAEQALAAQRERTRAQAAEAARSRQALAEQVGREIRSWHPVARTVDERKSSWTAIERLLALNPKDPIAWVQKGRWHSVGFEHEKAREAFDRAVACGPDRFGVRLSRGRYLTDQGRPREALWDLERAIRLSPKAIAFVSRGRAKLLLQNGEEALADASRALDLAPGNASAWLLRGDAHRRMRAYDEASRSYDKALEFDPKLGRAYVKRASIHMGRRRFDLARRDLAMAKRVSPKDVWIAAEEGKLEQALGSHAAAVAAFTRGLSLAAGAQSLREGLWRLRSASSILLKRIPDALRDLKASGAKNTDGFALFVLGVQAYHLERYGESVELLQRCAAGQFPLRMDTLKTKARGLIQLKRYAEAADDYSELAKLADMKADKERYRELARDTRRRATEQR